MKKTLKIMLIVITLVLSLTILTACGENTQNNNAVNNEAVQNNDVNQEENEVEFSRGKWTDNVYTNEFANIKFNLPEGWAYSSDEDIAELMNISVELLNEDQQKMVELAEQTAVYDMVASNPNTGSNVMIMFEKPALEVNLDYYINKLKTELEAVEDINYEILENTTTKTVSNREYTVITATVPDYNMVQQYYIAKEGRYFIDILVTSTEGADAIETIMSNFE